MLTFDSRRGQQAGAGRLPFAASHPRKGPLDEQPRKPFPDCFSERIVENTVEHRIGDRRQHPKKERQSVADRGHDSLLRKYFRHELVEDGVEDERAPADEEDGGDAAQQDVCSMTTTVHFGMLTRRSETLC